MLSFLLQKILICKCAPVWEGDFIYNLQQNEPVINKMQTTLKEEYINNKLTIMFFLILHPSYHHAQIPFHLLNMKSNTWVNSETGLEAVEKLALCAPGSCEF